MTYSIDAARCAAQGRAEAELARARDAAARAERHGRLSANSSESMRPLHARMAELYRRSEQRHLASAEVHRLFGLRATHDGCLPGDRGTSEFLAAVAGLLDMNSAVVTLRSHRAVVAVAASDELARQAHNLEIVMAEGPARDATKAGVPVLLATGSALRDRWPRYGPALAELGVTTVMAAPLGLAPARFGAMCALGSQPAIKDRAPVTLEGVAGALTGILLKGTARGGLLEDGLLSRIGPTCAQDVVNQAVGMVSVQCGCSVDDAIDLLIARAFAADLPLADIAKQVVAGQVQLADL